MKKIIICAAMLISLSSYAGPINQKVINKFNEIFPAAQSVKWYDGTTFYEVSFNDNETRCRVYYDLEGNIFRTIKYYDGSKLNPFLASKIKDNYGNKEIKGVTEMQEDNNLIYQVVLKDKKHLFIVNCDRDGEISLHKKFNNS